MNNCQTKFSVYQLGILTKAQKLKDHINNALRDVDFKHRCLKEMKIMNRHIAIILSYEHRYEQSAIRPIHFLINKARLPNIQVGRNIILHTSQISISESFNKDDVIKSHPSESEIQIREKGKRRVENECVLTLMPVPELHQSQFRVSIIVIICRV